MKRKPGVEIFERLLQTIVAPFSSCRRMLSFCPYQNTFNGFNSFLLDRDRAGALITVFWPVIYGLNALQGNEVDPFGKLNCKLLPL